MDYEAVQAAENKSNRGYILRCLAKGNKYQMLVRQIVNTMTAAGLIISPDISKQLTYLEEKGYIAFTDRKVTSYSAYENDAMVKLTAKGIDLVEGTIDDDGVDV